MIQRLSPALAVVLLTACSGPNVEPFRAEVEPLASPAGDGSGEPFLSATSDGVLMSWLQPGETGYDLRFSILQSGTWTKPRVVASSERFFVNWADFPSVRADRTGTLWAHWLQRGAQGGYDYGVRIARSSDVGATWTEPWTPHTDGTPTEHGFVSMVETAAGMGLAWLDGRETGGPERGAMTVRFREASSDGEEGPELLVDGRVCDCCQTDLTSTSDGAVIAYRNRSDDEIRDIYFARYVDGAWSEGRPVHEDGWHIEGCPVNGPALASEGDRVALSWFTAADSVPRVQVAFSTDGGATFGPPTRVDDGNPAGRVDVLMLPAGGALVTWLERTGGEGAAVRMRRVGDDGDASEAVTLSESTGSRSSGFPRIAWSPDGAVVLAWTDASAKQPHVRVARVEVGR